mmetsp:Transcript_32986/g.49923  ORF Transcript_32986/g.49923 Transcript_32986/m.49923 type:complete len:89 (-) Transcript_32986:322-588(-)
MAVVHGWKEMLCKNVGMQSKERECTVQAEIPKSMHPSSARLSCAGSGTRRNSEELIKTAEEGQAGIVAGAVEIQQKDSQDSHHRSQTT